MSCTSTCTSFPEHPNLLYSIILKSLSDECEKQLRIKGHTSKCTCKLQSYDFHLPHSWSVAVLRNRINYCLRLHMHQMLVCSETPCDNSMSLNGFPFTRGALCICVQKADQTCCLCSKERLERHSRLLHSGIVSVPPKAFSFLLAWFRSSWKLYSL
jgi:hypothetical protein